VYVRDGIQQGLREKCTQVVGRIEVCFINGSKGTNRIDDVTRVFGDMKTRKYSDFCVSSLSGTI
jgi:hypothetical protein